QTWPVVFAAAGARRRGEVIQRLSQNSPAMPPSVGTMMNQFQKPLVKSAMGALPRRTLVLERQPRRLLEAPLAAPAPGPADDAHEREQQQYGPDDVRPVA